MDLREDILRKAQTKGIDPFQVPFRPRDLGLKASDYGSFSDWCKPEETKSARYNRRVCLKVKEWRNGKPYRYLLLPRVDWIC